MLPPSKKDDMKTDGGDQQPDISDTPKLTKFNDFSKQIKEQLRNIDMKLFSKYFLYGRPNRMAQVLYILKSKADNKNKVSSIDASFKYFVDKVKETPKGARTEQVKILNIVNKFINFNEQNQ